MKNAKKILLFALALVALTLVMSLSIFAEETTCEHKYVENITVVPENGNAGSVTYTCANDGCDFSYTANLFYFQGTYDSWKAAFSKATAGDIIRMTDHTEIPQLNDGSHSTGTSAKPINKAVIIDLNDKILTTTTTGSSSCGIVIGGKASLYNGTVIHRGNTAAMKAFDVNVIQDVTMRIESAKVNTGGIVFWSGYNNGGNAHINVMRNVKLVGTGNYGIQVYHQGDKSSQNVPIIDLMENCEIDSMKYGIDLEKPISIGTIKDCIISGSNAGIKIGCEDNWGNIVAQSIDAKINFVGENQIIGDESAICIIYSSTKAGAVVEINAGAETNFINPTGGKVFDVTINTAEASSVTVVGYTITASGSTYTFVECDHNIVGGSCTEKSACSICSKVFDYAHTIVEDESKRIPANCTEKGKVFYYCSVCGEDAGEEYIDRDPNAHEWVITSKDATHTEAGYDSYNCKYGSCVGEEYTVETTPALGHSYNAVVTKPTCTTDGYTTYTCSCGDSYVGNATDKLGHNYVAGDEVDGKTVFTCTNCGDSYTCEHEWAGESVAATCTTAGYTEYECSKCGETNTVVDENAPALGHKYNYTTKGCERNCGYEYKVLEVSTWVDLNTKLSGKTTVDFEVVRLTDKLTVIKTNGNDYDPSDIITTVSAPVIIDLNGFAIETNQGYAPFDMKNAEASLVNGFINKTGGGRQALRVWNAKYIENIVINNTSDNTGVTGIIFFAGQVEAFIDVTVNGAGNHGIEAQNAGTTIKLMQRVKVTSNKQAMTLGAKIEKIVDCEFIGGTIGLSISNLIGDIYLENTVVKGGNLAVRIDGVTASEEAPASFDYDDASSITTGGIAFYIGDSVKNNEYCDLSSIDGAVALVNGVVYTDLAAAVEALKASTEKVTTFALIKDLTIEEAIVINKNVQFSLGGGTFMVPNVGHNDGPTYTMTGFTVTAPNGAFVVVEGGSLTISGDGTVDATNAAIVVNGGTLVIVEGTYIDFDPTSYVPSTSCLTNNNSPYVVKKEHTWVNANCTTPKTCSVCGTTEGEALGHSYGAVVTDPTCEEAGKTVYTCTACGDSYEEEIAATGHNYGEVVTAPTCTTEGYTTHTCTKCGDTYTDNNTAATGHSYEVTEKVEAKPGEAGYIKETCTNCGDVKTTEIEALPEHTHTEVEIPAVLPTPSVTGYTAGVKCSECGETIKAPVEIIVTTLENERDADLNIGGANLSLQENIAVRYWAKVNTNMYKDHYMVFVFNNEEYVITENAYNNSYKMYGFRFEETFPQKMADNIEAYVYARTADGNYSRNKVLTYSVLQYCTRQLEKNNAALTTMISDVLTYGAMTQMYMNYKTNALVTNLVGDFTLTPTAFTTVPESVNKMGLIGDNTGATKWKGATVLYGSSTYVKILFNTENIDNLVININLAGSDKKFTKEDFKYDTTNKAYYIVVDYIKSYEYDETITATFIENGEQVYSTLTYSINTYIFRNYNKGSNNAQNLLKALYIYGVAISNYKW